MEENPFQSDNQSRNRPAPCSVVIFGATGDLTNRKLIPVLYHIAADGRWARVVCEKPFGTDLPSAQHLNQVVNNTFEEKDTYRIGFCRKLAISIGIW